MTVVQKNRYEISYRCNEFVKHASCMVWYTMTPTMTCSASPMAAALSLIDREDCLGVVRCIIENISLTQAIGICANTTYNRSVKVKWIIIQKKKRRSELNVNYWIQIKQKHYIIIGYIIDDRQLKFITKKYLVKKCMMVNIRRW